MKKIIFLSLFVLMALTSCNKKGVSVFTGDYSYKMSGTVVFEPVDSTILPTVELSITDEIGGINITTLDRNEGTVMVVMNAMDGELSTASAHCSGNEITFDKFERTLWLTNIASGIKTKCKVDVEAEGVIYDNETMIVNVHFSGRRTYLGKEYDIKGDDILMVAYRND